MKKLAPKEVENNKVVQNVIENLGKRFGLTHVIFETEENIIIKFFDGSSPFGEVTLRKKNM